MRRRLSAAFKTGRLLGIGSPAAFNFAFIEFDFCQPVICHPYCPHHQFSDSFINCYLSYTQVVYRAMKNTVRIGSEGARAPRRKKKTLAAFLPRLRIRW